MALDKFLENDKHAVLKNKTRKKIGEILVSQGLITEEQLRHAIKIQDLNRDKNIPLGQILINLGYITKEKLEEILGNYSEHRLKKKLGEILIEKGIITSEQLNKFLQEQKITKKKLGEILIEKRIISPDDLATYLAEQFGLIRINVRNIKVDKDLIKKLPRSLYEKYKVLPLYTKDNKITVAISDPNNIKVLDHLKFRFGMEVEPVIDSEQNILAKIDEVFREEEEEELNKVITEMGGIDADDEDVEVVEEQDLEELAEADESGQQVIKLVNTIITTAIKEKASDIHIEPMDHGLRIRYRIDGVLVEKASIPIKLMAPVISRLKIISGMDISEKRKPQDGRSQIKYGGKVIDLRFSSFPANTRFYGVQEKIVIRILDRDESLLNLDYIGFEPDDLERFRKLIRMPNGIVLVTGPTGSGKSSTLYAALSEISTPEVNIVTLEDPVEYLLSGITQGQVNPKAGFTFAAGLRSILRQDPDIVMVGEMRDVETVEIAIEAALTGHLVLSTLHTNDAPGAFTRLIDMGIEPFLISSSVIGVLAQRLARKLCDHCKEEYTPEPQIYEDYGIPEGTKLYRATGRTKDGKICQHCGGLGYKGRVGIFELIVPDETIRTMIIQRKSSTEIKKYAVEAGRMRTLRQNGIRKVIQGITSLEEVLRVTKSDNDII